MSPCLCATSAAAMLCLSWHVSNTWMQRLDWLRTEKLDNGGSWQSGVYINGSRNRIQDSAWRLQLANEIDVLNSRTVQQRCARFGADRDQCHTHVQADDASFVNGGSRASHCTVQCCSSRRCSSREGKSTFERDFVVLNLFFVVAFAWKIVHLCLS